MPMEAAVDSGTRPDWLAANARAGIVFNAMSGSVAENQLETLLSALERHGVTRHRQFSLAELDALKDEASELDIIIVLGGDGTARAVAASAIHDGPPLLLLPGGTLNILPKALLGDLTWPEALEAALSRGNVQRLVGGTANGEAFFIAAMFGAPTLLARTREAIREGKWQKAWRRFQLFRQRLLSSRLVARPDSGRMRAAEAVGVLCPSFSGGVDGETLEWVRLDARNITELLRVGVRALGPKWRDDPAVHASPCRTGEILGEGLIPSTLDGEPRAFQTPVLIAYKSDGPNVVTLPH